MTNNNGRIRSIEFFKCFVSYGFDVFNKSMTLKEIDNYDLDFRHQEFSNKDFNLNITLALKKEILKIKKININKYNEIDIIKKYIDIKSEEFKNEIGTGRLRDYFLNVFLEPLLHEEFCCDDIYAHCIERCFIGDGENFADLKDSDYKNYNFKENKFVKTDETLTYQKIGDFNALYVVFKPFVSGGFKSKKISKQKSKENYYEMCYEDLYDKLRCFDLEYYSDGEVEGFIEVIQSIFEYELIDYIDTIIYLINEEGKCEKTA